MRQLSGLAKTVQRDIGALPIQQTTRQTSADLGTIAPRTQSQCSSSHAQRERSTILRSSTVMIRVYHVLEDTTARAQVYQLQRVYVTKDGTVQEVPSRPR